MLSHRNLEGLRTASRCRWLRGLWLAAFAVVVCGSLLPGGAPILSVIGRLIPNDKFQHFFAYAGLALLPALHESRRTLFLFLVLAAALAVALEFGQLLSPGRMFEVNDIVAGEAGVLVGALIGWPLYELVTRRNRAVENAHYSQGGKEWH